MGMGLSHGVKGQGSFRTRFAGCSSAISRAIPRALVTVSCMALVASCGGDSGTAPPVKPPQPVATIWFNRTTDSVEIQRTSTITASFFDATGNSVGAGSTAWSIGDSTIATISSAGAVSGIRVGTTTATLTADNVVRSLPVVVLPPAIATIIFPSTSFTVTEGDTLTIAAPRIVDRTGATVTGRTLSYSSTFANITVSPAGLVTALTAGSATVTATIDTAHTTLTVTILAAPIGRIKLIPSVLDMGVGHTIATQASAYSVSGQQLRGRTYAYSIDNSSVASVTSGGIVSGIAPGTATLTVVTGAGVVRIPISVARLHVGGFLIDLRFVGKVSPAVQLAAAQAAARWEQVISAPLIPYHIVVGADTCGKGIPAVDTTETSVMIIVQTDSIDGPNKTVGLGGPCVIRDDSPQLTALGTVTIDTADVAALDRQGILVAVLTHEMGHILGIGTLWSGPATHGGFTPFPNTASGLGGTDPVFIGHAARVASAQLGFTADSSLGVPIENSGGAGTRDAHWRATVFGHELMTGTINNGLNPLSLVTIKTLADFGYTVVAEAADDFNAVNARSPGSAVQPSLSISTLVRETILFPRFTISRTGTLRPIRGAKPPATAQ